MVAEEYDQVEFEVNIAIQGAPVILGIKPSNLLVIKSSMAQQLYEIFSGSELKLALLCSFYEINYYLLYHPLKLEQCLDQPEAIKLLRQLGYKTIKSEILIDTISRKYNLYMKHRVYFPHEIGLLLGYPVTDVNKFIQYQGKAYLYSGEWKVYDNLSFALEQFHKFKRSKEILQTLIQNGGHIDYVIRYVIQY